MKVVLSELSKIDEYKVKCSASGLHISFPRFLLKICEMAYVLLIYNSSLSRFGSLSPSVLAENCSSFEYFIPCQIALFCPVFSTLIREGIDVQGPHVGTYSLYDEQLIDRSTMLQR